MIHPRTLETLEYPKIIDLMQRDCISEGGRELASRLAPLPDQESAEKAIQLYEEFRIWKADPVANPAPFILAPFPDPRPFFASLEDSQISASRRMHFDLDAFWALRETFRLAQNAIQSITGKKAEAWPALRSLASSSPFPQQTAAALNRCISDDGLLKDESSPELFRLRTELRKLHQSCLHKVKDYAQKYNMLPWLQDNFMTLSSDRYVLPLKANFKGRMQGIIHEWSQTGETCYFEPMFLVEINNRLQELKHEERAEEQKVLAYLGSLLLQELPGAQVAVSLLTQLDFLQAKNRLAEKLNAEPLAFSGESEGVELFRARHPLLYLDREKAADKKDPVQPLDIILRPGDRALIITGGNAGGKTVCLKTLGLIAAMAMSGLPTPVKKGSHLPWFSRMDAFIGDEQSLADNVSTFTAQIDHLAKAWRHLDSCGIILLDEFGAGTDPAEGAVLAQAVLDELLEKRTFVLSATHFPALKSYALTKSGVRAACMLFNAQTGKPLFRLAYDQVGASQALGVAARHGLPESILARARRYLLQDGEDSSALLERLNALATQREEELANLESEKKRLRKDLEAQTEKLARDRQRLATTVHDKITELMRSWKAEKISAKQALKEMGGIRAELNLPRRESVLTELSELAPGSSVFHSVFGKTGVVMEVDEKRRRVRLDMGGVSLWAEMRDLRNSPQVNASVSKSHSPGIAAVSGASMTLDVRGLRSQEALSRVENFLDKSILAGYSELEIIHGRGTGALRRDIHAFLRSFPAVRQIALAPEDRGGDGMTIVELL